jgi:hypothetical protein
VEPVLYWMSTMPKEGAPWARRDQFNQMCDQAAAAQLKLVRTNGPLALGEFPVICVLRNEAARIPIFFEHYRQLGATRFIMIDNNSTDGSRELLLGEPSADVYHAVSSYRDGCCGIYWQNGLARKHCINHWVTVVDVDELLVYDGMEDLTLAGLASLLEERGQDRILSMLLDVYPSGSLGGRNRDIREILDHDCYFDSEGYCTTRDPTGWAIRGGMRTRVFERKSSKHTTHLSKFPFFHMNEDMVMWNSHYLWPYDQVEKTPESILLHLKFMDDFAERAAVNVAENQHWNGSFHYHQIQETLEDAPAVVAFQGSSRRYRGPKSLLRYRLMKSLRGS